MFTSVYYNDNMVLSKENIIHDDHLQIVYYGKVDNNSDKTIAAIFFKHESLMLFCLNVLSTLPLCGVHVVVAMPYYSLHYKSI